MDCVHFSVSVHPELMLGQQPITSCSVAPVFLCMSSSETNSRLDFLVILCSYLLKKKEVGWIVGF